jgi:hypothetical protein
VDGCRQSKSRLHYRERPPGENGFRLGPPLCDLDFGPRMQKSRLAAAVLPPKAPWDGVRSPSRPIDPCPCAASPQSRSRRNPEPSSPRLRETSAPRGPGSPRRFAPRDDDDDSDNSQPAITPRSRARGSPRWIHRTKIGPNANGRPKAAFLVSLLRKVSGIFHVARPTSSPCGAALGENWIEKAGVERPPEGGLSR